MTDDEAAGLQSLGDDLVRTIRYLFEQGLPHETFEGAGRTRAAVYFSTHLQRPGDPDDEQRGRGFALAWTLAERDLLERLVAVLSSPEARGRELEIIRTLRDGARSDDALRTAGRAQAPEQRTAGENIIPLRPR